MAELETQGQVQDFLEVLRKRKWQVALPALFVLAFGTVFAVIVPKKYLVHTQVELLEMSGGFREPGESATFRELANAQAHIQNYARVQRVVQDQKWVEWGRRNSAERHELILSVRDNIKVRVQNKVKDEGSAFVTIDYGDVDPRRAEKFLEALTAQWIDDVVQRDYNLLRLELDEYQNQVNAAQKHFDAVLRRFNDLVKDMGISVTNPSALSSPSEENPVFQALTTAARNREEAGAEVEQLRAQIAARRAEYDQMPVEILVEQVEEGVEYTADIGRLEATIVELRQSQEGKTRLHSGWRIAELGIEKIRAQIDTLESLQREARRVTEPVPNPRRDQVRAQIVEHEIELEGLLARFERWSRAAEEKRIQYEKHVEDWNDLTRIALSVEHAQQDLDGATTRWLAQRAAFETITKAHGDPYRIVERPRAPSKPNEPNPFLIITFSLIGGLAFGLLIAFVAEFSRSCFRSVHDFTRVMGVPVLGVVNEILTRADVRRRRAKRLLIGGSSAVILCGIAWFTYAWVFHPEKLPTELVQVVDDFRLSLR